MHDPSPESDQNMTDVNFEETLRALEVAVERLESEELSLEEALRCFEEGVRSAGICRAHLQEVRLRVDKLLRERDGSLVEEPTADDDL